MEPSENINNSFTHCYRYPSSCYWPLCAHYEIPVYFSQTLSRHTPHFAITHLMQTNSTITETTA